MKNRSTDYNRCAGGGWHWLWPWLRGVNLKDFLNFYKNLNLK